MEVYGPREMAPNRKDVRLVPARRGINPFKIDSIEWKSFLLNFEGNELNGDTLVDYYDMIL